MITMHQENRAIMVIVAFLLSIPVVTSLLTAPLQMQKSTRCKLPHYVRGRYVSPILYQSSNDQIYNDFDSFANNTNDESVFVTGLQKRVETLANAEKIEKAFGDGDVIVDLPVVCFDALLPGQKMTGSTTDPTFCEILRSLKLGGSFVMTSLNNKQRKLRRYGTIARIEMVDVEPDTDFSPTAVTFMISGKRRCEILGCASGMRLRVGRWRRDYDPDGEEARLGWGDERFVDVENSRVLYKLESWTSEISSESIKRSHCEWNMNKILIIDENKEDENINSSVIAKATYLLPLLEQWYSLASNPSTYDNIDVVVATRVQRGEPGLRINPTALLNKIRVELGPMPPPTKPTALAVWGAALINPLPALGVSPEVRGAVLHVEGAEAKLDVLERGIMRSINNMKGIMPL